MSDARWRRVGELFHELGDLAAEEQAERLAALEASEPEVAAEVRSLLAAERGAGRLDARLGAAAPEPALPAGAAIGPYRVVHELARGGMGVVYLAERADGAFERRVAIKLARPELVSPALSARFVEERRILASLDHPGIARLLDAGTTDDGRLYLVLELVEGERLDSWVAGRNLGERLRVFLDVCDAVEHAHRRLVLHRDLKPANILVTAEGRPKLLDFGIARLLDEERAPGAATRMGFRPLTPEYASPEQLRGEPLSSASDVWALGVVLYELLTGARPHELPTTSSPEERARRIETGRAPRPSAELRRRPSPGVSPRELEGDLDAIVGRALAPGPERRYPSVAELAADLRRHLEGRPVAARAPSLAERAVKFVRRHAAAVAAAAAFVVVLVGATAVSLRQAAIAGRERARAERRFADTRALARVFLFELPDRIERLAGSTGARELLVRHGLVYLDRLRDEGGGDPELSAELAAGYERLAQVQAGFFAANVGESAAALATLDRALEIRRQLAPAGAGSVPALAEALLLKATVLFKNGRMADAAAAAGEAAAIVDADRGGPAGPALDRARARALSLRGFLEAVAGELERGEASLRRALAILDGYAAGTPGAAALRDERARTLERLGSVLGQHEAHYPEVDRLWSEALALDRALLAEDPRSPARRRAVAGDLGRLSFLRGMQEETEAALGFSAEALAIMAGIAAEDPDDFEAQRSLALLRGRRSGDLLEAGRLDDAEREARASLAAVSALLARDPSNVTVEVLSAAAHQELGATLVARARAGRDSARWSAARRELGRALEIYESLIERGVLARDLGEAAEADAVRESIAECDRALAGR